MAPYWENMPTWLPWPRFNAPLHNFPPLWGAIMHRWTWWQHQMYCHGTLLIMVIEIRFKFQICMQCAEKAISNQRVTSKCSRTMGSERLDKRNKTGFDWVTGLFSLCPAVRDGSQIRVVSSFIRPYGGINFPTATLAWITKKYPWCQEFSNLPSNWLVAAEGQLEAMSENPC